MSPKRIVVVGAGLAGSATAFALARRGFEVEVIEALEGPGLETSFANGGILTPSMPDPWNGPGVGRHLLQSLFRPDSSMLLRPAAIPSLMTWGLRFLANSRAKPFVAATRANFLLCDHSTRATKRWRDEEKLRFDSADTPTLKIFRSKAALDGPLAIARSLEPLGLRFNVLDAATTVAREPALAPIGDKIAAAISYPDDFRGDAHLFTREISARAADRGARFHFGARAEALRHDCSGVTGLLVDGDLLEADAVVICAANASQRLVAPLGLSLPVRPAKGYSLTFDLGGANDGPNHGIIDDALHAGVVPVGTRLRVAGTAEFTGENRELVQDRVDNLRKLFGEIYPGLSERLGDDPGQAWTGLRPMSADGRPFIGQSRVSGLWLNTGHGHLGWTMAAGSAELIEALITGDRPPVDPEPFRASRV